MTIVSEIKERVEKRIAELEPMLAEYHELVAVRDSLDAAPGDARQRNGARALPRRRGSTSGANAGAKKPGRAEQALVLIGESPGITVKEIAQHMDINDNYLYRLLPRMEREGQLKRQGRGWAIK